MTEITESKALRAIADQMDFMGPHYRQDDLGIEAAAIRQGADAIDVLHRRVEWFTHAVHTCHDQCDRPLCKTTRERDSLRAEVESKEKERRDAVGENGLLRAEVQTLKKRVRELEGQHKGLVLNNAILRQRPDLPVDRIPAALEVSVLRAENSQMRDALSRAYWFFVGTGEHAELRQIILAAITPAEKRGE